MSCNDYLSWTKITANLLTVDFIVAPEQLIGSSSQISLVVTKSHVCYQLGGVGLEWVRISLGSNSVVVPVVYLTMLSL